MDAQNTAFPKQYPITQVGYQRADDTTTLAIFPVAPKQTLPYANCKDCEHHMARALEPDSHVSVFKWFETDGLISQRRDWLIGFKV